MRIPSDYQIPVQTPRAGVLEALGLKPGEAFTAQVIGQTASGSALLQVGGQQINLALPIKPQLGQILQFQVKIAGAKPELILLGQSQSGHGSGNAPAANTSAQTSPQAQAPQHSATPPTAQQFTAQAQSGSTGTAPAPASPPAPGAPAPFPQGAITLPANVRNALALQPGQVVTAHVVNPTSSGQPQIAIGTQQFAVPSLPGNPAPGTTLQFQVHISNGEARLISPSTSQSPNAAQTAIPSQAAARAFAASAGTASAQTGHSVSGGSPAIAAGVSPPVLQAITQAIPAAVARQDSLGALIASLTGLQKTPDLLPASVTAAARQILHSQLNLTNGPPNAEILRDAVGRSGVFAESMLVAGRPVTAQQGDMKIMLLLLRNVLGNWLGEDGESLPPSSQRPAPPMRGGTPRSPATNHLPLPQGTTAQEAGQRLLAQTDSALSRLRLFQFSSLPEMGARPDTPGVPNEWNLELPFSLGQEQALAQFQIFQDEEADGHEGERGWHMVFSINFSIIGEVGAKVSFRARKTGVMLWAEEEETAKVLEDMLPELVEGLEALGLEPGAVRVHHGAPEVRPQRSGGFVDSVS